MNRSDDSSSSSGFAYLDHTADVWVHAWGSTVEQAFEQCVYGLMDTMIENFHAIEETTSHPIEIVEETKPEVKLETNNQEEVKEKSKSNHIDGKYYNLI